MRKLLAVVAVAACSPAYDTAALDTFTNAYACPVERQTIARMPAPAAVAADPERRELWERAHHIYDIAGCGRTARYECEVDGDLIFCNPYVAALDPLAR
ncbi:MAG TPA: hypothetical protein VLX92_24460 [Kofleriaceae bacterium]|nr:hypothetical protein [Kofleriaceae bacterium]